MKKGNDKSIMFNTHLDSRPALYSLLTLVKCENCSIHQKFTNKLFENLLVLTCLWRWSKNYLPEDPGDQGDQESENRTERFIQGSYMNLYWWNANDTTFLTKQQKS